MSLILKLKLSNKIYAFSIFYNFCLKSLKQVSHVNVLYLTKKQNQNEKKNFQLYFKNQTEN